MITCLSHISHWQDCVPSNLRIGLSHHGAMDDMLANSINTLPWQLKIANSLIIRHYARCTDIIDQYQHREQNLTNVRVRSNILSSTFHFLFSLATSCFLQTRPPAFLSLQLFYCFHSSVNSKPYWAVIRYTFRAQ